MIGFALKLIHEHSSGIREEVRVFLNLVGRVNRHCITTGLSIKEQFMVNTRSTANGFHFMTSVEQTSDFLKELICTVIKFIVESVQKHKFLLVVYEPFH